MGSQRKIYTYVSMMAFLTTQLLFFAASDKTPEDIVVHDWGDVGVCYGTLGNNLPRPEDVVNLLKTTRLTHIRIYNPNPDILNALPSYMSVIVGVPNELIPSIATDPGAATSWINTNIIPYKDVVEFRYILVGNEVIPGPFATSVAPAMANMIKAMLAARLAGIGVSTSTAYNLGVSFPPSAGAFPPDIVQIMQDITHVLRTNVYKTHLHVSIYPYFAYISNLKDVTLEYATFRSQKPIQDGPLQYFNLLDAQIDAYHAALEKIGAGDTAIIVAETGWPTAGNEPHTSIENARLYNSNLYKRIKSGRGTPKWPYEPFDAYIFALFDENMKAAGIEQYWGLFTPNMVPKYPLIE